MLVYGDPSYTTTAGEALSALRATLASCQGAGARESVRALLIRAGEVEQALADSPAAAEVDRFQVVTDCLAAALLALDPQPALTAAQRALATISVLRDLPLTVKVPEGFAFYTLYPEQYAAAAQRWLQGCTPGRALVVGVRSIGTTLSAVVAAALRAEGWEVRRLTVRPTGHPYAREAALPELTLEGNEWGLVVDEGPGHSGSSMASVAEALHRAGLPRSRIHFFPSHMGEPGHAASEAQRAWWQGSPRWVGSVEALRFEGRSLQQALAAATLRLTGAGNIAAVEEWSAGAWRASAWPDSADWPAVCAPFEATKSCFTLDDGRGVVWKFAGLASVPHEPHTLAEGALGTLRARAAWGTEPLGTALGFVATWLVRGQPLTRAAATPEVLTHIGRYIAAVTGSPLALGDRAAAFERLRELLYWNVWEALGEEVAEGTRAIAEGATHYALGGERRAGDGRLALHEWRRASDGRLIKLDGAGHEVDHTLIGPQPVGWDVSGALVEWGLTGEAAAWFLDAYAQAGGSPIPRPALRFYRLAFAAFRLGQCAMCAGMTGEVGEQARLWAAVDGYRAQLVTLLADA